MKISISLDDELLKRADTYADENYITRSGLISLALSSFLNAQESRLAFSKCANALQRIADSGNVDDDTMQELQSLAYAFGMASGRGV